DDDNETSDGIDIALNSDGGISLKTIHFADGSSYNLSELVAETKITCGTNHTDIITTLRDNDLIYSLNGGDEVHSGLGNDTIYGGNGMDLFYGDGGSDAIYGEAGSDTLFGGNGSDYLFGGNGVDYLYGERGKDTLDGGSGADVMSGGLGDDTYIVDNPDDVVMEYYNEGTDTVQSSKTYNLSNNIENLILTGSSAINGTGNDLDNIITGNSAGNTLTGNAGNDTLDGSSGNDMLIGGNGSDTYLFRRTDGQDVITETAGVAGDIDALKLTDGITTTEPVLVKQNDDLYVFIDSNDYVTIVNEFQQTNYGIERLEVTDGHYITRQDIQTIVDTMSAINNSGMDVMQKYNAMMADQQYQNILAQSWQQ
ncbi:MAG: calcium-binding protein, partial [Smithella sp.]